MPQLYNQYIKIMIFLFPIILFLIFLGIKVAAPQTYRLAVQEDSVVEYAQVCFYFLASIVSLLVSLEFFKKCLFFHSILYGILTIGLLFVSLEEISWGQRLFNIEIPDYFAQHNIQDEITFHNLRVFQKHLHKINMIIGLYGTFSFLLLPLTALQYNHVVNFIVPSWFISPYFFFVLFMDVFFHYISPYGVRILGIDRLSLGFFVIWRDQEPAELLLSLGFLVFAIDHLIKSKKTTILFH